MAWCVRAVRCVCVCAYVYVLKYYGMYACSVLGWDVANEATLNESIFHGYVVAMHEKVLYVG